jgi:DEAD/DEAH box helicase domain-containing protein
MTSYFSRLVDQSISRAKESTLSVLGIANPSLRNHLSKTMSATSGTGESFLAQPLFESMFGWEYADPQVKDLKESLLSNAVINALDDKSNGRYRFKANFQPFKHQLDAWKTLLEDQKSIVVTSGTGSGKTECFMVPVLEDLYREYQQSDQPLVGVRALFLYPLNALINSQQERLDAWTRHFGSGIRYCLYNGNTDESESQMRKAQYERPNQVLSRELLRREPAPILVTNGTILEYMLVRQIDAPIITQSREQKSLRWIVLDEAHSYAGSQAAELAMQLRRVLQAFGVEAKDVRFVATSATIAGEEANEQLRQYLADLAGVTPEQVKVIGGRRVVPELDFTESDRDNVAELAAINPEGEYVKKLKGHDPEVSALRFNALTSSPTARVIREAIVGSKTPLSLTQIKQRVANVLQQEPMPDDVLLAWFDLLTATKPSADEQAFLKLRTHLFQRMTHGLWSCIDKACPCKKDTDLQANWPFGYVYSVHRQTCDCGAPVLELVFCTECNEPHLFGRDRDGRVVQWDNHVEDEFSLQLESQDIEPDNESNGAIAADIQTLSENDHLPEVFGNKIDKEDNFVPSKINKNGYFTQFDQPGYELSHDSARSHSCCECGFAGYSSGTPFRRAMLGAPFYIANVVPTLLEFSPDYIESDEKKGAKKEVGPQSLPARGRRLITFTDSRQGTARLSVRMQQEAERSKLRGAVVEVLRAKQLSQPVNNNQLAEGYSPEDLIAQAKLLRDMGMNDAAIELEQQYSALQKGGRSHQLAQVSWKEMVHELSKKNDFQGAMLLYNKYLSPEVFGESDGSFKLADMLLFREFSRRPKRQNSTETQGLVKVSYAGLERIKLCPARWEESGFTLNDWRDFIKVSLDFYVRENNFLSIENGSWLKWIGSHFSSKSLVNPKSNEKDEGRIKKWPQVRGNNPHRLVKLLSLASNISLETATGRDVINDWLVAAWNEMTNNARILTSDGNKFALDRDKLTFSFVDKLYVCRVTNKLLDTTFRGISPYLPRNINSLNDYICPQIDYPSLWHIETNQLDFEAGLRHARELVAADANIAVLRENNLWTDINDRAVEGGFYYRTAEHSAQQSNERLQAYEEQFKNGKINVLNCSTTMEMGVDIGGISAVVMNNVPPHPANYLQRAGRAGRSSESRAISYTLCKGNPHDQQVFAKPHWPFTTLIAAPKVTLDSARLVQRHVNSLLLSLFLDQVVGNTATEKTKLNLEWFYAASENSICEQFITWLASNEKQFGAAVLNLVKGTALATYSLSAIRSACADNVRLLKDQWIKEYHYLVNEKEKALSGSPYQFRLDKEHYRLTNQFLLGELAAKAFLPGYGFPTDVVNFDNNNCQDYLRNKAYKRTPKAEREDNVSRYRGLPSRNLAVAIREYAPGAEIVLDGRVFRSGGVALHWHNVTGTGANEAQKFDFAWRCDQCGQTGYETDVTISKSEMNCTNTNCGAKIKPKNTRRVLQPTGFVADFYHDPTNDISVQRFIPVESAWISTGRSTPVSLPNSAMGTMTTSTDGTVFHHSSGAYRKGYALCMTCGRAESMDKNGDYPRWLNPTHEHRPIRAPKHDKNGDKTVMCEGSTSIQKEIHLGCHAKTDVLEVILKHPLRHEYILDNAQGRIIATTLAVALRSSLAGLLGIRGAELGFAIRPAILDCQNPVLVLQVYDVISGGAGFASSANKFIQPLINKMVENLSCDKCTTGCGECLLDSDTRHHVDLIDSQVAREWLGEDFTLLNQLPAEMQLLTQAQYQPYTLARSIRNQIEHGANKLVCWLSDDSSEWDLTHPHFKRAMISYVVSDGIEVTLVVPNQSFNQDIIDELLALRTIGVQISVANLNQSHIAVQIIKGNHVISLATNDSNNLCPGEFWHQLDNSVTVISENEPQQSISEMVLERAAKNTRLAIGGCELDNQLNGKLSKFGEAFWMLLLNRDEALHKLLSNNLLMSVKYSDRYIQSPSTMLLISQIISSLCKVKPEVASITIETLYHKKERMGHLLHHDWQDRDEFISAYSKWLEYSTQITPTITCHDNRSNIAHRRLLVLQFTSGIELQFKLDQGVGYWQLVEPNSNYSTIKFNYHSDLNQQLVELKRLETVLKIRNSEQWSTDVSYQQW